MIDNQDIFLLPVEFNVKIEAYGNCFRQSWPKKKIMENNEEEKMKYISFIMSQILNM